MNYAGLDVDLYQLNTVDVMPFLVSSRGYGILWDNTSYTRFGDRREWAPLPAGRLYDATGKPGGLTGSYHAGAAFERRVAADGRVTVQLHDLRHEGRGDGLCAAGGADGDQG